MTTSFNRFFKLFGFQVKKEKALENERAYFKSLVNCLSDLYNYRSKNSGDLYNNKITGIVFSKNRAMQLQALLSTYLNYTINAAPLKVIYAASSPEHSHSYEILTQEFRNENIEFLKETNFRNQLISLVEQPDSDRIFFLTDDAIFLRHFDLSNALNFNPLENIFSLRLGKDIDFSFTYDKPQGLPDFYTQCINGEPFNNWIWAEHKSLPDWSYPLSVDATIFSRVEINIILNYIGFTNPNSLEANLQVYNSVFLHRNGICYDKAKYVNVPCNIVQTDFKNLSTGQYSVEELLNKFKKGKRIDWSSFKNMSPKAVQKSKYTFT